MPGRKKLRKEIYRTDFDEIEYRAQLLEVSISKASVGMNHYTPHGEAMMQLRKDLRKAINVLGNRPPDYHRHNGHMSPGEGAWHLEIERKGRESLPEKGDDVDDDSGG
ncbi:hypothetical protein ABMA32_22315 [Mesorhizobium sp. VNQ89]|uniref:hypothetical protein n=1 Tax=Mesorhizobium quangtriensis TaxID=3157709 RepID=UPI0032B750FD